MSRRWVEDGDTVIDVSNTMRYRPRGATSLNYRDLRMFGLHSCATCGAVVRDEDRPLHDDWHTALANHGHPYAACYGPGGEWDTTTGPVPAKAIT